MFFFLILHNSCVSEAADPRRSFYLFGNFKCGFPHFFINGFHCFSFSSFCNMLTTAFYVARHAGVVWMLYQMLFFVFYKLTAYQYIILLVNKKDFFSKLYTYLYRYVYIYIFITDYFDKHSYLCETSLGCFEHPCNEDFHTRLLTQLICCCCS